VYSVRMTTCRKCNGTGFLPHFAHSDHGRCWACQGVADTSYTKTAEAEARTMTDEDRAAAWATHTAAQNAARRARRSQKD
jgi:DnaJ-class molecular chaperone